MTKLTIRRHPSGPVFTHEPPARLSTHDRRPSRASGRPRLGLRLRVWLGEHELDAALARGADPAASDELGLRAQQLARPEQRARLADAIEELGELADGHEVLVNSEAWWAATSPYVQLEQIRTSRSLLLRLVNRLRDERPVDVQGLAKTRRLLRDDRGPLYHRNATPSLEEAVAAAIGALDPWPVRDPPGAEAAEPAALARLHEHCTPQPAACRARGVASTAASSDRWRSSASSESR